MAIVIAIVQHSHTIAFVQDKAKMVLYENELCQTPVMAACSHTYIMSYHSILSSNT